MAQWYVAQVAGGDRNPARTLADRYPDSSYKTWTNTFSQMRSREPSLLTGPPRRGVAGGQLTDYAAELVGAFEPLDGDLANAYRATRLEVVETRTKSLKNRPEPPKLSRFPSDAAYRRAWVNFENARSRWGSGGEVWEIQVETGEVDVEADEDWWIRVSKPLRPGD